MREITLTHSSAKTYRNRRIRPMPRITVTGLLLPLFLLFAPPEVTSNNSAARKQTIPGSHGQTGTLQKMIVETGTVTMELDLNRLEADGSLAAKTERLRFTVAANSFFSILVFNDLLRGPETVVSIALAPHNVTHHPS